MIGFNKDVGDVSPVLDERMRHSQVPLKVLSYFSCSVNIKSYDQGRCNDFELRVSKNRRYPCNGGTDVVRGFREDHFKRGHIY